jgi:hypothetical protein
MGIPFGKQPFGGRQELQAPVGLQLAAAIWGFRMAILRAAIVAGQGDRCHDGRLGERGQLVPVHFS